MNAHDVVTIVGNLADNAMDAAAEGTAPRWVEVGFTAGTGILSLRVADSGPGVDAQAAGALLTRGYTTKGTDGYGRGIGLAPVQQTVNRLGGTLEVAGGAGAVFTVALPVPGRTGTVPMEAGHGG